MSALTTMALCLAVCVAFIETAPALAKEDAVTTSEEKLLQAAYDGNLEVVRHLISHGVNVNCRGNGSQTPLLNACFQNHTEVAFFLLDRGAKATVQNSRGDSSALNATASNNLPLLKRLVEAGADINKADTQKGSTPLIIAARHNYRRVIKFLLHRHEIDVLTRDFYGADALHYILANGDAETIGWVRDAVKNARLKSARRD